MIEPSMFSAIGFDAVFDKPSPGEFNRSSQHSFKCEVLCMSSKEQLIDKQVEFWVLMARGSTLTAACEAVGVNRRTGGRWRQATGGQIPRKRPPVSGRYLSLDERLHIADLHLDGQGVRAIAGQLGRSASTVFLAPGIARLAVEKLSSR